MQFRILKRLISTCAVALSMSPALANEPLEQAIELWLEGDDIYSLSIMANLARDGNADARLLLARIETTELGPSPFRQSLRPEQSKHLFRAPGNGDIAKTWLSVEADLSNPLAQALRTAAQPEPNLALIKQLADMGEYQATDHPTRILALYGTTEEKAELLAAPELLPDLKPYIAYLLDQPEPRGDGLAALRHMTGQDISEINAETPGALGMAELLALGYGYGDHGDDNPFRPAVESWVMSATSTLPIRSLCDEQCGEEAHQCAFAFMALSGGFYEAIRYDSPLETLIPQDRFLPSPRAQMMVLRRTAMARAETNLKWLGEAEEVAEMSQCAAEMVVAQRAQYD